MIKKEEIERLKKRLINNYTKEEMTEGLIIFCNMIHNLIEDNREYEPYRNYFKDYEEKAYEQTGLKMKFNKGEKD